MTKYTNLLSPIKVGTKTYKNRIVNAPRGGIWVEDPEDDHTDPEQISDAVVKCRGGVAVYEIGETAVSPSGGRGANEFYDFTDFSEGHMLRYVEYANAIHENGALAMVELCHMGQAKPESEEGAPAFGPSECVNEYGETVTAMTIDDIRQTADDFAAAAYFMQKAGFDGVDIHCGHGWLIHQFLSPRYNHRTDEFGGSIVNRSRLAVMIAQAIREKCGEDFIIEARISGRENMPGGYSDEDIVGFARELDKVVDIIHVSAGVYQKPMETLQNSTLYDAHGCNIEVAAMIKSAVNVPVAVVGGINNPDDAEKWIADGKCDVIVLCRQLQADPAFALKAANGKEAQIRKCLRCMRCYPGPFEEAMEELHGEFPEGCSVNPYLLHFDLNDAPAADTSKKVLVIGGGVAGMQAALTCAKRGHAVTLTEKSDRLGGILNFAEHDKDKYDLKALADSMAAEVYDNSQIKLMLNTADSAEMMGDYDEIIISIGSSPLLPPIPGIENAISGIAAYNPQTAIGESVIMLGGGLVGAETAVHLSKLGKKVTIVEMRDELAPDAYRLHKHKLRQIIAADENITTRLGAKCIEVLPDGVRIDDGKEETLSADTVVAALGMKANPTEDLEKAATAAGKPYHVIGDCKKARKIFDAIEEGFMTAMEL